MIVSKQSRRRGPERAFTFTRKRLTTSHNASFATSSLTNNNNMPGGTFSLNGKNIEGENPSGDFTERTYDRTNERSSTTTRHRHARGLDHERKRRRRRSQRRRFVVSHMTRVVSHMTRVQDGGCRSRCQPSFLGVSTPTTRRRAEKYRDDCKAYLRRHPQRVRSTQKPAPTGARATKFECIQKRGTRSTTEKRFRSLLLIRQRNRNRCKHYRTMLRLSSVCVASSIPCGRLN